MNKSEILLMHDINGVGVGVEEPTCFWRGGGMGVGSRSGMRRLPSWPAY